MTAHPALAKPALQRRRLGLAGVLLLAGCGTAAPPPRLYRLAVNAPGGAASAPAASTPQTWELAAEVSLPEYLDRETLVVAAGDTRLQALAGHRWAEPLRDSVPRLLRHDLALLRGADRIWAAPAPPGVAIDRVLRLELLALHADALRRELSLQARWWLTDPRGRAPPLQASAALQLPVDGEDADAIVRAHRLGLWRLAERIAGSAGGAG